MRAPIPQSWLGELQSQGKALCPKEAKSRLWSRIQKELNLPQTEEAPAADEQPRPKDKEA